MISTTSLYCPVSFLMSLRDVVMESLDDDCLIPPKARAIFLERIYKSFGVHHDDKVIRVLTKELKDLICHNTDLNGKIQSSVFSRFIHGEI
jgi:hypothetical protein